MKRILLLAFASVIAFTGCKKDDDETSPKASYKATATLNNAETAFNSLKYTKVGTDTYIVSDFDDDSKNSFSIFLPSSISVGTVNFGPISSGNTISVTINEVIYSSSEGNGTIVITAKDSKSITGTYSGTFTKGFTTTTLKISGSFSAEYFE